MTNPPHATFGGAIIATSEVGLLNRVLDTVNPTTRRSGICLLASLVLLLLAELKNLAKLRVDEPLPQPAAMDAPAA